MKATFSPTQRMPATALATELVRRRRLSPKAVELTFSRPAGFTFLPGQRIRFSHRGLEREYSLTSARDDDLLTLCVQQVATGRFSSVLSSAEIGTRLTFSGPGGYFTFQSAHRPAVFVATGTGLAPFLSMARSGTSGFRFLHGVRGARDLYYRDFWQTAATQYVPCLSGKGQPVLPGAFKGRVTDYLKRHLPEDAYDFYLCGRGDMIRDAIHVVDDRFPASRVYTEIYF